MGFHSSAHCCGAVGGVDTGRGGNTARRPLSETVFPPGTQFACCSGVLSKAGVERSECLAGAYMLRLFRGKFVFAQTGHKNEISFIGLEFWSMSYEDPKSELC